MGKESVWPLEARSCDMAGLQRCCLPLLGENSCRQSSGVTLASSVGNNADIYINMCIEDVNC